MTPRVALACLALALLAACAPLRPGLMDVIDRPPERALLNGMRAYDDGQYPEAEKQLQASLKAGLGSARDRAAAHKLLAFVYCSSQRMDACEAAFRAARNEDRSFSLNRAEAGHPLWGPVYKRVSQ
jgi:Tfp pilus assembly protein PilF